MRCAERSSRSVLRRSPVRAVLLAALTAVVLAAGCSPGGSAPSPAGSVGSEGSVGSSSAAGSIAPSANPSAESTVDPSAMPSVVVPRVDRAALAPFYDQRLEWRSCEDGYQCATLRVPLRYDAPDEGEPLRLPVVRLRAAGTDRIGSLVVNPGGPGGSGVRYARLARQVISASVRARYDVVGLDPRGVQGARPAIDCLSDRALDRYIAGATTVDNAAVQLADSRRFARGCARRSPDLYPHVGTTSAARDLDLLRAALGERRLDYLGKSYGTLLGITFAETFPNRVGRLVLDGVVDPSLDPEGVLRGQTRGFERAYRAFLRDCVRRVCPLGDTVPAAYARTVRWIDDLAAAPLGPATDRQLTAPLAQLALLGSLYEHRSQWARLREALAAALAGSPGPMLQIADATADRSPDGSYPDNSNEAQYAITCLDRQYPANVVDTAERGERLARVSAVFGEYLAWGDLPCTEWRTPPTRAAHEITTADIPPMLLLGTTRDPATPVGWSRSLRRQLGDAVHVTWRGDGHTAYHRGSTCVDSAVDTFLLQGELPAGPDHRCG